MGQNLRAGAPVGGGGRRATYPPVVMSDGFALGVAAALSAPLLLTVGFFIWEGLWRGSAFQLNVFKNSLATCVFLCCIGALNAAQGVAAFSHGGSALDVGMLLISAFVGITLGDTCWLQAMQMLGARRVIVVDVVKPFLAALFGYVGLGEPITAFYVLGLLLTMTGVAIVSFEKERGKAAGLNQQKEREGQDKEGKQEEAVEVSTVELATGTAAVSNVTSSATAAAAAAAATTIPLACCRRYAWCPSSRVALGYAIAFANVFFDVLGAFLTRSHGTQLTTFDINAIRFGSSSATMLLVLLGAACVLPRGSLTAGAAARRRRATFFGAPGWRARVTRRHWIYISVGVLFVTFGCPALSQWALFQLPLGICLCLTSVGPLYAIPLSFVVRRERVTARAFAGSLLACGGVAVLYLLGPQVEAPAAVGSSSGGGGGGGNRTGLPMVR